NAKGHGERDRNRQRHDQRETPFPKSNQRDSDYQDDRFHQGTQEKMNVLLNLQRLIGSVRDDEIRRKNLFKLCKFLIDRLTEVCDLLLIAHIDRQRDGTTALPLSSGVLPRVIVQIGGRSLIAGENLDQVPQINRSSSRGLSDSNLPNCVSAFELAGRIDDDLSLVGFECASRRNDVAGAQNLPESCRLESVLSQAILRIFQIDYLGQQSSPLHF